ncbi:FlxA-like family protein [Paenibacillus sp. N3/727]|uniref:FlxA-like family protein n=1 Tax=Paenibacillus sp. N3/727 TaxID=2925845 RepID=UPI001F52CB7E|nr:FlxA-like family protein [Paenibacillus sp. N3/727]UNK18366.1 FlxA-like family protein [Paenibacillus sp. N3/727]
MNISSATSNNSTNYTSNSPISSLGNSMDREIQQLIKMKTRLQEQIQKATESNMDVKEKQLRIKDLKSQMQEIDSQIKQKQTDKLTQKKNEEAPKQEAVNADPEKGQSAGMTSLVLADLTYTKAQAMNLTKKGFERELRVLNKEMSLDAGRGFVSSSKSDRASEIESRVKVLDKNLGETLGDVHDKITESTEDVKRESEAIRERANEEKGEDVNHASDVNPNNKEEDSDDKRTGYKHVDIRI